MKLDVASSYLRINGFMSLGMLRRPTDRRAYWMIEMAILLKKTDRQRDDRKGDGFGVALPIITTLFTVLLSKQLK